MKSVKILTVCTYLIVSVLFSLFNFKTYQSYNEYVYDSMFIFNDLTNIVAYDYETSELIVVNRRTMERNKEYKLDEKQEDLKINYYYSDKNVFLYFYNDKYESLYSIDNKTFKLSNVFKTNEKINENKQYLNFNDYIFFYKKDSKLSLFRIKDNIESTTNFDIPVTNVTELDKYGYSFVVNDKRYCFDNSEFTFKCSEALYEDENYRGKYIINKDDNISVYNKYSKEYEETIYNNTTYKDYKVLYINKKNQLYFMQGKKDTKLQMIPYLVMVNPTEEIRINFNKLDTSYTDSKQSISNSIYFSDLYVCATGSSNRDGKLQLGCYIPETSENVVKITNKDLNFMDNKLIDSKLYKTKFKYISFTVISLVITFLLLAITYKIIKKHNIKK